VFLPWFTIYGFTYTFFGVDDWKVLPVTELVIATGSAAVAMIYMSHIKRIGLILGGSGLVLNILGSVAAARFADVHNTDTYFRIWAVITVRPAWGGWIALLASGVVFVGALSRWSVWVTLRQTVPPNGNQSSQLEVSSEEHIPAVLAASQAEEPLDSGPRLPSLDDILASPQPVDSSSFDRN